MWPAASNARLQQQQQRPMHQLNEAEGFEWYGVVAADADTDGNTTDDGSAPVLLSTAALQRETWAQRMSRREHQRRES